MEIAPEGHNIVLVGAWNRRILTPPWISEELLEGEGDVAWEFAVNNPSLPSRLTFSGVQMKVSSDRLILAPETPTPNLFDRTEETALAILDKLTHTPLSALGINFRFSEHEPSPHILEIFSFADADDLADADAVIRHTRLKRTLLLGDDILLNLTLELDDNDNVSFDFNFHSEVSSPPEARDLIATRGMGLLRNHALNLLSSAYNYDMEELE